jgi:hypothetical protein
MEQIKVWFVTPEATPFAKTGGLADVAGSLPRALKKLGIDVRVVMPKYRQIPQPLINKMMFLGYTFVDLTWRHEYCGIFTLEYDGVPFYFLDNEHYFYRDWYYGQPDDGERFTFFCKAVLETAVKAFNFCIEKGIWDLDSIWASYYSTVFANDPIPDIVVKDEIPCLSYGVDNSIYDNLLPGGIHHA